MDCARNLSKRFLLWTMVHLSNNLNYECLTGGQRTGKLWVCPLPSIAHAHVSNERIIGWSHHAPCISGMSTPFPLHDGRGYASWRKSRPLLKYCMVFVKSSRICTDRGLCLVECRVEVSAWSRTAKGGWITRPDPKEKEN